MNKISSQKRPEWYIAMVNFVAEPLVRPKSVQSSKRCTLHANYHLIRARTAEQAYEKATKIGKSVDRTACLDQKGRRCVLRYAGISDLVPVYDDLEDGAELLWSEQRGVSFRAVRQGLPSKKQLIDRLAR